MDKIKIFKNEKAQKLIDELKGELPPSLIRLCESRMYTKNFTQASEWVIEMLPDRGVVDSKKSLDNSEGLYLQLYTDKGDIVEFYEEGSECKVIIISGDK